MNRINLFADESGNFDFSRNPGASRYFILTTIACTRYDVGDALLTLRRDLAWNGLGLDSEFHATSDSQAIRNRVFEVVRDHPFRIDATIVEKSKADPGERFTEQNLYRMVWKEHMAGTVDGLAGAEDELFIVSASLGTRRKRSAMHAAVQEAVRGARPTTQVRVASWDAQSDPCLQAADYCCWAMRRKWEMGGLRSYDLIIPDLGKGGAKS